MGGGVPLRFLSVDPDGPRWLVRAGEEIAPTPDAIRRRIEAEIRRDPARWGLWPEWLAYLDRRAALAPQAEAVAAPEPVVAADSLSEVVAG